MAAVVGFGVEDAKTHFAQTGAFKSWLLARNPPPLIPSYITQEVCFLRTHVLYQLFYSSAPGI